MGEAKKHHSLAANCSTNFKELRSLEEGLDGMIVLDKGSLHLDHELHLFLQIDVDQ